MQGPQIRGSGRAQSLHDIWEESLDMQRQRRRSELSVDTAHPSAPSSAANQWIGSPAVDSRWRSPASDPLRSHPGSAERQGSVDDFLAHDPDRRGSVHAFLSLDGPPDPSLFASLLLEDEAPAHGGGPPAPYPSPLSLHRPHLSASAVGEQRMVEHWPGGFVACGGSGMEDADFQLRISRQLAGLMSNHGAASPIGSACGSAEFCDR